jgi:predicted O-methyltransferase YrrM
MDKEIFGSVDEYINGLFGIEDSVMTEVEKAIVDSGIPQISVSPNQGKFLHILARISNASKILEVGTLGGFSTIWMARALPASGKLITLEIEPKHVELAKQNFATAGLSSLIDVRLGKAIDILPQLLKENAGPFDMIFIDADKEPYTEYFEWALKLSRKGTLIVADNVIREGKVIDSSNSDEMVKGVQRFNKALSKNKSVTATIIQTIGAKDHDGMALAVVD